MPVLDRLEIVNRLEKIRANTSAILRLAVDKGVYDPQPNDFRHDGLVGTQLEKLVKTLGSNKSHVVFNAELKTSAAETRSAITIMVLDPNDLLLGFGQTRLFAKIEKMVIAITKRSMSIFYAKNFGIHDAVVDQIFTFDATDDHMYDMLKADFDLYVKTGSTDGSTCLIVDKKSDGNTRQWRFRHSFLSTIRGNHSFAKNALFEI